MCPGHLLVQDVPSLPSGEPLCSRDMKNKNGGYPGLTAHVTSDHARVPLPYTDFEIVTFFIISFKQRINRIPIKMIKLIWKWNGPVRRMGFLMLINYSFILKY